MLSLQTPSAVGVSLPYAQQKLREQMNLGLRAKVHFSELRDFLKPACLTKWLEGNPLQGGVARSDGVGRSTQQPNQLEIAQQNPTV